MTAVVITELTKRYGQHTVLKHLNLQIGHGSIYGLVGPNGAGKTTSLSIMAGLVAPTSGCVSILGMDVVPNCPDLVAKIGFASPRFTYFDYLGGAELLALCGRMHGLSAQETQRRTHDLLLLLDLQEAASHSLCRYSQGMRQKLALACALIHAPEVILLDEPFMGLDPVSVYRIFHTLRQMAARGRTVVLTSHDLALVERLCDRVGILFQGALKRQIDLAADTGRDLPHGNNGRSGLESVLWEVVGSPEFAQLAWL